MSRDARFREWWARDVQTAIGWDRYDWLGSDWGAIAYATEADDDAIAAVSELDDGDSSAFRAAQVVKQSVEAGRGWMASGSDPGEAIRNLEAKLREAVNAS